MKRVFALGVVVALGVIVGGCKSDDASTAPTAGEGVVNATIVDALTGLPVQGATASHQGRPGSTAACDRP